MREIEDVGALAKTYDLAVSGAGPAGMAAETAAGLGLSTLALDENAGPGGQIYRAVTSTPVRTRATLGEDYWRGAELAASFGASNGDYARAATVWSVGQGFDALERENGLEVAVSRGGSAHLVGAKEVVLAMGALERPFPIPGWTLPGVMTAGAAQIALKSSGLVPDGRVVVAGTGPLLLLLTQQLRAAGAAVVALLDTHSSRQLGASPSARAGLRRLASPQQGPEAPLAGSSRPSSRPRRIGAPSGGRRPSGGGLSRQGRGGAPACDLLLLH
jgi:hypothetical protein